MSLSSHRQAIESLINRYKIFANQNNYGILVAEVKGMIVGWVAWSKSELFVSSTTRIHIEGLIVDKHHRGQGIGKQLVLGVEKIAQNFKPCIIDLASGLRRAQDGTHEFYKALGYKNEGHKAKLYLRKEL